MEGEKKMKKIVMMLLTVALVFSAVRPVSALTNREVLDNLEKTYTINGHQFQITPALKKIAEDYVKEYGDKITEKDLQTINDKIGEAVKIIENAKVTKIEDLSAAAKKELKDLVADVKANTSINVTYANGALVVYTPEGEVFEKVTDLVKQTGTETNTIAILAGVSFVVMLAGAFVTVRKVRTTD